MGLRTKQFGVPPSGARGAIAGCEGLGSHEVPWRPHMLVWQSYRLKPGLLTLTPGLLTSGPPTLASGELIQRCSFARFNAVKAAETGSSRRDRRDACQEGRP